MINDLVMYFFIYAFVGWLMEVIYTFFLEHRLVNRGFLIGPYCPIYGVGCVFIILLLDKSHDILGTYLKIILIASLLEYFTSYILEKIFKARWWDYSYMRFNINGRICLETMLPFGVLAMLVLYFVQPFIEGVVTGIPNGITTVIVAILLLVFLIDLVISGSMVWGMKGAIKEVLTDNTAEIKKRMKLELKKHKVPTNEEIVQKILSTFASVSVLRKRIVDAFPHITIDIDGMRKEIADKSKKIAQKTLNEKDKIIKKWNKK